MKIVLNSPLFEYDLRGLLQAFFPWEKFETDAADGEDALSVSFFRTDGSADAPITVQERGVFRAEIAFTFDGKKTTANVTFDRADPGAKTLVKRAVYALLSGATGRTLPWGTLTGIRPTKIATEALDSGKTERETLEHLESDLLVSPRKAALSLEIARRESAMLSRFQTNGVSLYVGIPFCPSTCLYCSFSSVTIGAYEKRVGEYIDAVERELDAIRGLIGETPLHSVYFGGGTPTSLSADELARLLRKVQDSFTIPDETEWTVEAGRPDSVTEEKLAMLRAFPVTRVSVNPQTLHQKTLDLIGRYHTVDDFYRAFAMARDAGLTNINTDLILGLPGETAEDMRETVRRIAELSPESVTIHSLAVKRSSRLNLEKQEYLGYRMENTAETMDFTEETLKSAGLFPYYLYRQKNMAGNLENVGYAKPGKECDYNVLIMEETESILAAGAGASTKRVENGRITRAVNPHDVNTYLMTLDALIEKKRALFSETGEGMDQKA